MSRLMSVAFTEQAVRDRAKTVTRRKGWWADKNGRPIIRPGDRITLCRKVMGRKKGEPLERICDVEVVAVSRQSLENLYYASPGQEWAAAEVAAEGFPGMPGYLFVQRFFIDAQRMKVEDMVTRIEWRYLDDEVPCLCGGNGRTCDCSSVLP